MKRKSSRLPTANYFDDTTYGAGKQKYCSFGIFSFL